MIRFLYRCLRVITALFVFANGLIDKMMAPFFPDK